MKKQFIALVSLFIGHSMATEPSLYGSITRPDGQQVTGTIQWDDEETFLSDIFNGRKIETVGLEYLTPAEIKTLTNHQPGPKAEVMGFEITFKSIFGKEIDKPNFYVPFGAIKTIDVNNTNNQLTVTLHDGSQIITNGGSNDIDAKVNVLDKEGEKTSYDMDDLEKIEFFKPPATVNTFGEGIYGEVESESGTYSGRIMWDQDERLLSEELDGSENGQDYEIKFADIAVIEKKDNASLVTLKDGKTLLLRGTNDVNQGNRGIYVNIPGGVRKDIKWSDFKKLTIQQTDLDWNGQYQQLTQIQLLSGVIELKNGEKINAKQLAFDLNHQSSAELLNVQINGKEHFIPFYLIASISPLNELASTLTLRDGSEYVAYGERYVTRDNNGIMALIEDKNQWIQWQEVKTILFNP